MLLLLIKPVPKQKIQQSLFPVQKKSKNKRPTWKINLKGSLAIVSELICSQTGAIVLSPTASTENEQETRESIKKKAKEALKNAQKDLQ